MDQYFSRCGNTPIKCSMIEEALLKNPDIVDCGVFAKELAAGSEAPAAWVVVKPDGEKKVNFQHNSSGRVRVGSPSELP